MKYDGLKFSKVKKHPIQKLPREEALKLRHNLQMFLLLPFIMNENTDDLGFYFILSFFSVVVCLNVLKMTSH